MIVQTETLAILLILQICSIFSEIVVNFKYFDIKGQKHPSKDSKRGHQMVSGTIKTKISKKFFSIRCFPNYFHQESNVLFLTTSEVYLNVSKF